jgi:hypothetical protein
LAAVDSPKILQLEDAEASQEGNFKRDADEMGKLHFASRVASIESYVASAVPVKNLFRIIRGIITHFPTRMRLSNRFW